ncbi:MAG: RNA methyltransferase [Rickettsiaceae bacterium H1]|nr:RNA methyltransferase [Rickettsiaceae bacterium H1]
MVICDESGKGENPKDVLSKMSNATILIGPEGGFSFNELEYKGVKRITLGKQILRVDTAAVVALTYLKAFLLSE